MSGVFDAISPAVRNRIAMQKELERRKAAWSHPTYYKGAGDLLLQHGECYEGRILPEEFRPLVGEPSSCFDNAAAAVTADPRLTYCEGVFSSGANHYTSHAWCIYQGRVLEVTLPTWEMDQHLNAVGPDSSLPFLPIERWGYWGVRFNIQLVYAVADLPLLDRPAADAGWEAMGADTKDDRTAWPALEMPWSMSRTAP